MKHIATQFCEGYSLSRKIFAYLVFPLVFGTFMVTGYYLIESRYELTLVLGSLSLLAFILIGLLERIQPHARMWSKPQGDTKTDIYHVLISQLAIPELLQALIKVPLLAVALLLSERIGFALWPGDLNFFLQIALAMLVSEFLTYWWHRLSHENDTLWRFHATHHSPRRLYWLNAGRFHPIDAAIQYTLQMTPLLLLGCPAQIIVLVSLFTAVHGMFQHANIELRLGILNYVFSMAELHRWHHSVEIRDQNNNYGANLIFWDLIFGTFHFPRGRAHKPNDVGFEGAEEFPQDYIGQLKSPFRWREISKKIHLYSSLSQGATSKS